MMPAYRVEIRVMPRASLLDPQGQAVNHALHALGFADVGDVRVGKHLVLQVTAKTPDDAASRARAMCDRLLANPVTEDYELLVETA
jgi:phosphoribosylformylglycinamidine synthase subunit PurS